MEPFLYPRIEWTTFVKMEGDFEPNPKGHPMVGFYSVVVNGEQMDVPCIAYSEELKNPDMIENLLTAGLASCHDMVDWKLNRGPYANTPSTSEVIPDGLSPIL